MRQGWSWRYLGQKGGKHYHVSSDHVAALIALQPLENALEFGDGAARDLYFRIADEVCALARAAPAVYVALPRGAPPLLHLHSDGELWLALEDWPIPNDVLRLGRLPYAGPRAACCIDYVLDAMRRERTRGAYVRVVRGRAAMFHFQVRTTAVIVAERAW